MRSVVSSNMPSSPAHEATASGSRSRDIALLMLCAATWALAHPYSGIVHDGSLYTLQAFARLHPNSLAHDVFLSHGSQDRFSLFSPLYALALRTLGADAGAATVTFVSQLALCAAGWRLARSVGSKSLALLGTLALIARPGIYGADRVFACI